MDYGVYTPDVEEVINFTRSGRLLRNPVPPADLDLLIIHDLSQADQYREPLLDDDPSHEIPKAWIDIKCQAGTADETIQMEKLHRIGSKVREALARLWERELYYDVERAVASQCQLWEIQEIAGDLEMIAVFRAASGRTNAFTERMFRIYQAGGYPCGWSGNHPEGTLVAYFPPSVDRSAAPLD